MPKRRLGIEVHGAGLLHGARTNLLLIEWLYYSGGVEQDNMRPLRPCCVRLLLLVWGLVLSVLDRMHGGDVRRRCGSDCSNDPTDN